MQNESAYARAATTAPARSRGRRLLTSAVFLTTVLTGAVIIATHPVKYVSSGTVVIVGTETVAQLESRSEKTVNPADQSVLARFGDPTVVGDIFARIFSSSSRRTELERAGMRGNLEITTRRTVASLTPDHGPVIVFTVVSGSPGQARAGVELALKDFRAELARWQQGAAPGLSVSSATVTSPLDGVPLSGSRPRATVGVVALAALLAWAVGRAMQLLTIGGTVR